MDPITPMTELEAVNDMLSVIGESSLADLDEVEQVADAQIAYNLLRRVSRDVQSQGWHWNTEEEYRLTPDNNGNIILPVNTLKVDPTDYTIDYVARAGKLWDRANQTDVFEDEISLDIVFGYTFEELPENARKYITARAARMFENRMQGDAKIGAELERDELMAKADLLQEEADNADLNLLRDSSTILRFKRWR